MRQKGSSVVLAIVCVGALASTTPAYAQRQAASLNLGGFFLNRDAQRPIDDVLFQNQADLLFEIRDFDGFTIGGEYLIGLNEFVEAGIGVNFYRRTVPSIYVDFVDTDGSEIAQDLRLQVVPVVATLRVVPTGLLNDFQPYFGGGVGVFSWEYTETGDFVDFSDFGVFTDTFHVRDTTVGGVILAGARFAMTPATALGAEFRYYIATGQTGGAQNGFLGDRIDLGGYNALFTITTRF